MLTIKIITATTRKILMRPLVEWENETDATGLFGINEVWTLGFMEFALIIVQISLCDPVNNFAPNFHPIQSATTKILLLRSTFLR